MRQIMMEAKKEGAQQKIKNAWVGIIPKDLQRGLFYAPCGHESEKWKQVTWSPVRVLADQTGWVCAC